ncbi:MAG: peroxide stress protein YaaA [Bacteroidetes bacterium]|nr:peroxide stress protein YaaA [Bacteroidota bacterium]
MIAILSPAKNLDTSKKEALLATSEAQFLAEAKELMNYLKKMKAPSIAKLMDLSPKLADLNYQRFQDWELSKHHTEGKAALYTFNGDAYLGLAAKDFNKQDLEFAQKHLRILSGLYGLLRPLDLILAYRLEMGRKLNTKKHDNLYGFWGSKLSEQLNKDIEASGSPYLINLASAEYFKAAHAKTIRAKIITCEFKEFKNGEYKVIMTFAKKARGTMAKFMIENKLNSPEELKAFNADSYEFRANLSSETNFVFTRG